MAEQFIIRKLEANPENRPDTLRIKRTRTHGNFTGFITVFKFQDKDTHQIISYCPSFDISGYGETIEQAEEMLKFSVKEFFQYLLDISPKQREKELYALGWKQSKFSHKEFSKAYVDINGELQNLNAVDNKVERLILQTI